MKKVGLCPKVELAQAYLPNVLPKSALNRLMAWIKRNKKLMEALEETGYFKTQKYFSPIQVDLIMRHLGEP
ncbi:MAG: DUF4248 domain-containing protein [Bacteroidaceae bacterium]|nr:DUF4248 domain-containing protein [Bacteroidaceae bacterium]